MDQVGLRERIVAEICQALGEHARDIVERGTEALPVTAENVAAVEAVATKAADRILALRTQEPAAPRVPGVFRVVADVTVPRDEIHWCDHEGNLLGKIVNVGKADAHPAAPDAAWRAEYHLRKADALGAARSCGRAELMPAPLSEDEILRRLQREFDAIAALDNHVLTAAREQGDTQRRPDAWTVGKFGNVWLPRLFYSRDVAMAEAQKMGQYFEPIPVYFDAAMQTSESAQEGSVQDDG